MTKQSKITKSAILLIRSLFGLNVSKEKPPQRDCDHIYYPEYGMEGHPIGQKCSVCGRFNSISELKKGLS